MFAGRITDTDKAEIEPDSGTGVALPKYSKANSQRQNYGLPTKDSSRRSHW